MQFEPGEIYHVYNQGNNRELLFYEVNNYLYFLGKLKIHLLKHCDLLAWCLMPNHFHWMIKVHEGYDNTSKENSESPAAPIVAPLNRSISTLLSSYTKAMNKRYGRSGKLIRSKTKAKNLNKIKESDDYYPLICFNYIHQNPVKAGLVERLEDWKFSSFRDYAGIRNGSLSNQTIARKLLELPENSEDFVRQAYQMIHPDILENLLL